MTEELTDGEVLREAEISARVEHECGRSGNHYLLHRLIARVRELEIECGKQFAALGIALEERDRLHAQLRSERSCEKCGTIPGPQGIMYCEECVEAENQRLKDEVMSLRAESAMREAGV